MNDRLTGGLGIWFVEDIHNALASVNEAGAQTAAAVAEAGGDVTILRAYREGYKAALASVALAFGLSPAIVVSTQRLLAEHTQLAIPERA